MSASVRFDGDWQRHIAAAKHDLLERIGRAVLPDMEAGCPRDTGYLLSHLEYRIVPGDSGSEVVRIGSRGVDYAASVEAGSRPHIIRSHGNYPLRNRETGQVFGREVHHPGGPAQPFMRPALYRRRGL